VPRGVSRVGTTPPLLARQREPRTQRKRSKWPPLRRLLRYASCAAQEKLSCAAQEKLPLTSLTLRARPSPTRGEGEKGLALSYKGG